MVEDAVVMGGTTIKAGAVVKHCIVAENVVIGENAVVGAMPADGEKGVATVLTALCTALVLMGGFSVPAYAGGGEEPVH